MNRFQYPALFLAMVLPVLLFSGQVLPAAKKGNGIGLRGKVKSMRQTTYEARDSAGIIVKVRIKEYKLLGPNPMWDREKPDELNMFFTFNEAGRVTSKYHRNGWVAKETFTYDSLGRLAEFEDFYRTRDTIEPNSRKIYLYDDSGTLYKIGTFPPITGKGDDSKPNELEEYHYYSRGKIEDIYHWIPGTASNHTSIHFVYDDLGRLTEKQEFEIFNGENKLQTRWVYSYDNKGKVTELDKCWGAYINSWGHRHIYSYDSLGRKTKVTYQENGNAPPYPTQVPNIVHKENYNTPSTDTVFSYDEHNNISERDIVTQNARNGGYCTVKSTYKYVYDNIGNWIERIDNNGSSYLIIEHEIAYY